jgi:hypothetical protein
MKKAQMIPRSSWPNGFGIHPSSIDENDQTDLPDILTNTDHSKRMTSWVKFEASFWVAKIAPEKGRTGEKTDHFAWIATP